MARLSFAKSKFRKLYWKLIPYDWRPGQVWYRLQCFVWYRYTTVRPKTLKFHTWCDRDCLLEHCIMQIMTDFVEKEMVDGPVDWHSEEEHKEFYNIMLDHRNWWKMQQTYELIDSLPEFVPGPNHNKKLEGRPELTTWGMVCVDKNLLDWYHVCEQSLEQELTERLVDIVQRRKMMWT